VQAIASVSPRKRSHATFRRATKLVRRMGTPTMTRDVGILHRARAATASTVAALHSIEKCEMVWACDLDDGGHHCCLCELVRLENAAVIILE
jgi:hypothetical protein